MATLDRQDPEYLYVALVDATGPRRMEGVDFHTGTFPDGLSWKATEEAEAVLLAATMNFGFFIGDMSDPKLHNINELYVAIFVNLIALVLKATLGLRVSEEDEERGVDLTLHDESAYHYDVGFGGVPVPAEAR